MLHLSNQSKPRKRWFYCILVAHLSSSSLTLQDFLSRIQRTMLPRPQQWILGTTPSKIRGNDGISKCKQRKRVLSSSSIPTDNNVRFRRVFSLLLYNKFILIICIDESNYTTVPSPPFDSISSIRYSPTNPSQLLVSAWDAVGFAFYPGSWQKHTHPLPFRQWGSMRLARMKSSLASSRPNSTIVQRCLLARSTRMVERDTVADWTHAWGSESYTNSLLYSSSHFPLP